MAIDLGLTTRLRLPASMLTTAELALGICRAAIRAGRKARCRRSIDPLIAATALAHRIPLYTLNAADLRGLDGLIEIVDLS